MEGPAVQEPLSDRQLMTSIPKRHPELHEGLQEMATLCREARELIEPRGGRRSEGRKRQQ